MLPQSSSPPAEQGQVAPQTLQLTPELVQKVAAKVYALMLADLKTERERRPLSAQERRTVSKGGRHGV